MARNMRRFYEIFETNADRMEYYYMLLEEKPEQMQGVVGCIFNDTNPNIRVDLEVDPEYLHEQNSLFPMLYVDPENYYRGCRIILNSKMAESLYKQDPEIVFEIWHELGHYHTMSEYVEEYMNYSSRKEQAYTADQYISIVSGEVLPYEAAADDFAAAYCGPEQGIVALNGMIARVKKHPVMMNNRGLIQDLLNRKKRILAIER